MTSALVFDNTPLSHFARAGRLDVLEKLVAGRRCVTPEEVANEILAGIAEHPALAKRKMSTFVGQVLHRFVESSSPLGLLIHAAVGSSLGVGGLRTNRSGWVV
jgi:hypothetical protein